MVIVFMLSHFTNFPVFKTTIPTANPLAIQRFPVSHSKSLRIPLFGLESKKAIDRKN